MSSNQSNKQFGQSVGAKIRAARLAKKYTQSQLAQPDFSVSYISAIERGQIQPSLRALEIIATRLGLSSKELIPDLAVDIVEAVIAINKPKKSEDEIELDLLEAQTLIRQGEFQQAITQLRQLDLSSTNLTPRQQLHQRYLLGWAYANTAQLQESEDILAEANRLAEELHGPMDLQILNLLGTIYASLQNYSQALKVHQDCLEQLEKDQFHDPFFLAQVYNNLGAYYVYLNKAQEAIEMFQHALAATEELAHPDQLVSMYSNLSRYYANQNEYQQAAVEAYKALDIAEQKSNRSLASEMYHYLGEAMRKAEPEQAYTFLQKALQEESVKQNALTLASVNNSMAEWLLDSNDLAQATEEAQKAHTLALSSGNTIIAADILITLGRIAYAQGQYEAGDTHFEAAIEMLKNLGALDELTEQAADYAQLLEEHGESKKAFSYYRLAYKSHRRMREYAGE